MAAGLANLAVAAVSVAACLAAAEGAARLAVRGSEGPRTVGILSRYDPLLGWAQPARQSAWLHEEEFDTFLEINADGLRGPDRGVHAPPGTRRVLLLGDSFAEGYTVGEPDSVRAVLERRLGAGGCGRWEVINAGVAGYSTDQEYLYYAEHGHRYGAEQVVLLFFGNDPSGNVRERKKPYFEVVGGRLERRNVPVPFEGRRLLRPQPDDPWSDPWLGSVALEWVGRRTARGNPDLHRRLARVGLVRPLEDHGPTEEWLSVYGPPTPRTELMWERTEALLAALDAAVRAEGASLVVLYVPARFEVSDADWVVTRERWGLDGDGWSARRVYERLSQVCARHGIPLLDPRPALRAAQQSPRPAYLRHDPHWNERGHAIAAQAVAGYLQCGSRGREGGRAATGSP